MTDEDPSAQKTDAQTEHDHEHEHTEHVEHMAVISDHGAAQEFGTVEFYSALGRAFVVMLAIVPILTVIHLVNVAFNYRFNHWGGVLPRQFAGLDGLIFAPFLYTGFNHLLAICVPLILLGTFTLAGGTKRFLIATVISAVASGLGAWLTAPSKDVIVGASGLIFGWLGYLLVRGIIERSPWNIAVSILVGLLMGWEVLAVLPDKNHGVGVSVPWEFHLFGFLGGVAAALILLLRLKGTSGTYVKVPQQPTRKVALPHDPEV